MKKSFLLLEDGTEFSGYAFGDEVPSCGEVVFTTAMTGYQESLTDPSFHGQILTLTYPLIGNVGVNDTDEESPYCGVAGLVVRELCEEPSNWKTQGTLDEFLKKHHVRGICGVDTRALTLKLREGVTRGKICAEGEDKAEALKTIRNYRNEKPMYRVSTKKMYEIKGDGNVTVAVMDYGIKENMLRELHRQGANLLVFPCGTSAEEVLSHNPDGIFLSNGPGDPAEYTEILTEIKKMLGKKPMFGICMGHQLLALAHGLETFKMAYGHRGANHPVKNITTGKIFITSQNHGYAVKTPQTAEIAEVTHVSLNDGSVEGLRYRNTPCFSVQFHPEACPGPQDTAGLFAEFIKGLGGEQNAD